MEFCQLVIVLRAFTRQATLCGDHKRELSHVLAECLRKLQQPAKASSQQRQKRVGSGADAGSGCRKRSKNGTGGYSQRTGVGPPCISPPQGGPTGAVASEGASPLVQLARANGSAEESVCQSVSTGEVTPFEDSSEVCMTSDSARTLASTATEPTIAEISTEPEDASGLDRYASQEGPRSSANATSLQEWLEGLQIFEDGQIRALSVVLVNCTVESAQMLIHLADCVASSRILKNIRDALAEPRPLCQGHTLVEILGNIHLARAQATKGLVPWRVFAREGYQILEKHVDRLQQVRREKANAKQACKLSHRPERHVERLKGLDFQEASLVHHTVHTTGHRTCQGIIRESWRSHYGISKNDFAELEKTGHLFDDLEKGLMAHITCVWPEDDGGLCDKRRVFVQKLPVFKQILNIVKPGLVSEANSEALNRVVQSFCGRVSVRFAIERMSDAEIDALVLQRAPLSTFFAEITYTCHSNAAAHDDRGVPDATDVRHSNMHAQLYNSALSESGTDILANSEQTAANTQAADRPGILLDSLPRPNPQRGVERNIANATTASIEGNPRQVTFEPQQDYDQDLGTQRDNLLRQDTFRQQNLSQTLTVPNESLATVNAASNLDTPLHICGEDESRLSRLPGSSRRAFLDALEQCPSSTYIISPLNQSHSAQTSHQRNSGQDAISSTNENMPTATSSPSGLLYRYSNNNFSNSPNPLGILC